MDGCVSAGGGEEGTVGVDTVSIVFKTNFYYQLVSDCLFVTTLV